MSYPTNPTAGDTHILSGKTWKYDGTNWSKLGLSRTLAAPVAFSDLTSTPTTLSGYGITGNIDAGGNKVLFANMYTTEGDLPSATTYHGMFAHVHATGAGYFAHAGNWVKLANHADLSSISTDYDVVFPSDWGSPTNTYSTSGTWSKGSLTADDYVWIYLLAGGAGGGAASSGSGQRSAGGTGGFAHMIYAKAGVLDGGVYVIGSGTSGVSGSHNAALSNPTTFTLTEANGGATFSTANSAAQNTNTFGGGTSLPTGGSKTTISLTGLNDYVVYASTTASASWDNTVPTGMYPHPFHSLGSQINTVPADFLTHHLFAGGGGGGKSNQSSSGIPGNTSEFAGNGGDGSVTASATHGTYPGGGGGGSMEGLSVGGNGANGNMRDYHV